MKKLLAMALSLLFGLSSCAFGNGGESVPVQADTPHAALAEQAHRPVPTSAPEFPETDAQAEQAHQPSPVSAPGSPETDTRDSNADGKNKLNPVDHIDGNSVLTVEDVGVYYEFDDHGYMSVGLDGTLLPYDVYYGIRVDAVNDERLNVTWHNYSDLDVKPTTITIRSPYYGDSNVIGDMSDLGVGEVYGIMAKGALTGPYVLEVAWDNGVITPVYFYMNGDDLYICQVSDHSSTYLCYWYDRKDAIDSLLAEASATPENSLDYSDSYWAYPVPADYGEDYRCDNSRWIGLARELTTQDMSDAQKAVVIHDWMVANLSYDWYKVNDLDNTTRATANKDYSGQYSMWDTKVGVCADFTTVYCIMLRSLGIPAVSLDENDEHVWNIVYLDGDWVEIDLTDDIDRMVYGEDVNNIVNKYATVDYSSFGTPYENDTIYRGIHNINLGIYTYSYLTGQN